MSNIGKTAAIIVAAGTGTRAGNGPPKQFRLVRGKPMICHSVEAMASHPLIDAIVVVVGAGTESLAQDALQGMAITGLIAGGETRRDSVKNGLQFFYDKPEYGAFLIHDAARPFLPMHVIDSLIGALQDHPGAVPALPIIDSLARSVDGRRLASSQSRDGLWRIQTPQAFRRDAICLAHDVWNPAEEATDDAGMVIAADVEVTIVPGDECLAKYTFARDFEREIGHDRTMPLYRTGTGYDVHRLESGQELWLCGIKIDHDKGLSGHSDADVALHALTDAILGAAALGDIGDHFPPSDPQWRGASSDRFLAYAVKLVTENGYKVANVDLTIICEAPKIGRHRHKMREKVAEILASPIDTVSVKATTTERLGFTGRGEGIAAQAVATLFKDV
jgi:2-C-methyl-D-erythritol 4-phosphate cytidylyltransferase/2-C-methyl-D-erythritol 2,4-cyclodiphosphate synthase